MCSDSSVSDEAEADEGTELPPSCDVDHLEAEARVHAKYALRSSSDVARWQMSIIPFHLACPIRCRRRVQDVPGGAGLLEFTMQTGDSRCHGLNPSRSIPKQGRSVLAQP